MTTPNLQLPEVPQAILTASDEINIGFLTVDAVLQLAVLSRVVSTPPASSVQGDRYIIPAGSTFWGTGRTNHVAFLGPNGWLVLVPRPGWIAWCIEDANMYVFDEGQWNLFSSVVGVDSSGSTNQSPPRGVTFTRGNAAIIVPVGDVSLYFDTAQTIIGVLTLGDDTAGDCEIDIWKKPLSGGYPPTVADSITSASPPTLSGARSALDTSLTGWDIDIAAGDIVRFNLVSCSAFKTIHCYLILEPVTP